MTIVDGIEVTLRVSHRACDQTACATAGGARVGARSSGRRLLYPARMATDFQSAFGPDKLRAFAWGRSFERGAAYAADGRVKGLKARDGEVSATVRGARAYQVRLWLAGGEPQFSCTCPVAADGLFCKHCVAVGLVACESDGESGGAHRRPARPCKGVRHTSCMAYMFSLQECDLDRPQQPLGARQDDDGGPGGIRGEVFRRRLPAASTAFDTVHRPRAAAASSGARGGAR